MAYTITDLSPDARQRFGSLFERFETGLIDRMTSPSRRDQCDAPAATAQREAIRWGTDMTGSTSLSFKP